jgi:hypothetical protein
MLKMIQIQNSDCGHVELCLGNKDRPDFKKVVVIFHSVQTFVAAKFTPSFVFTTVKLT